MSLDAGTAALAGLAVLGLLLGSFLNVVIHRVPEGLSLVRPGSACPACGHPVRPRDNVPVLSWVLLRGRCRDCGAPISARYPAVELTTAVLFGVMGWRFGASPYLVVALALAAGGVALTMIDLEHRRLPFPVTGTLAGFVVAGLLAESLLAGTVSWAVALASAAVWVGVYGAVYLVTFGRGMGLGDVALAPVLGLALGGLGWGASLTGLLGGFVLGAVVGLGLLAGGRAGRRTRVPHGPFMLVGAALGLLAGEPLWRGYLGLVGLA